MLDFTKVFAAFPVLETKRLLLRESTLDDAAALFSVMSDANVIRYLGPKPMTSVDEAIERIRGYHKQFADLHSIRWVVTLRESGRLIGTGVLKNLETHRHRAALGYTIAADTWGKGFGTEIARAVIRYGFETVGLHSIEAQIDAQNEASITLVRKLDFVQEGHYREDYFSDLTGRFTDTVVFSLLARDWQERNT